MRLMPASCAAWSKLVYDRVTPGSVTSVVEKPTLGPKKESRTVDAAPLYVLWPETYSGKLGVVNRGSQVGSAVTSGLTPSPPPWMTVIGRQVLKSYLAFQAVMPASARLMSNSANRRASSARLSPACCATVCAIAFQWPAGV